MPTTPTLLLPYPAPGDAADVPTDMQELANRIEGVRGAPDGLASLDAGGLVPTGQLPADIGGGADLTYEGDYAAATAYQDGDIVVHNGIAYLCVGGPITGTPPDPAPWGAAALSLPSYGTSLPASPSNGQEAILVDSLTAPTYQWRFRYNASASGPYKWEFVGGTDAYANVATDQSTTPSAGTWFDLATVGPRVIVPRAGDYDATFGLNAYLSGVNAIAFDVCIGAGAGSTLNFSFSFTNSGFSSQLVSSRQVLGVSAGAELRLRYYAYAAITYTIRERWLRIRPVRVA